MTTLKSFIIEQLYLIKKSVRVARSENVTPNNLELIEALKDKMCYYRNENLTKAYITKVLTENQATDHVKTTTTPKIHQQDTAVQKEVIPKTRFTKYLPNKKVFKPGNNPPVQQNKESVKKKTLIVGDSIIKHIDGRRLNKK